MKKNKKRIFKASNGKNYVINRFWCYDNIYFCAKGLAKKHKYIVIHNTGGSADRAVNVANYFLNNKERYAGAHFVIDEAGIIYQCGRLKDACYAVGGVYEKQKGGSKYLYKCNNYNSISIELCGITDNEPTKAQTQSCKAIIEYIQKYRKNAKTIIRHWDVNSKECPKVYIGPKDSIKGKAWAKFKKKVQ